MTCQLFLSAGKTKLFVMSSKLPGSSFLGNTCVKPEAHLIIVPAAATHLDNCLIVLLRWGSDFSLHGFPTIILLNSTMRVAYRGSRTLDSLVAFYTDVTCIEPLAKSSFEKNRHVPHFGDQNNTEPENGPVSWVRRRSPPENLFCQETYLTLATVFVLLRLVHLIFPALVVFVKFTWGRVSQNMRSGSLLEHSVTMYLREPSMSSNLEEGAMSATAWASKSLATFSIGDSSSLR
ncbi:hypothetical protein Bca4012_026922 [Brassica carinata]